ncbi:S8 family serine peptidase [Marixanthomonas ophiurae]|uniref:T9SS C-terminal target domain-containing protein n=1 Tax=Marixanthomonas ophiurae TaxID=387659 RepID=A0A3E1QCF7_9FLAO|nr:S8 family serine peptidase [Marixanthomonas ophiurae]RFN59839.1 T9SS C-terminal target domain-containing protein [Marixanthomonas ophiurae]
MTLTTFKRYRILISLPVFFLLATFQGIAQTNPSIKIKKRDAHSNNKTATNKNSQQSSAIIANYDHEKLSRLYNKNATKQANLKREAEQYALLHNIPLKIYNEDGSFSELQKLADDGSLIYYTLTNVDAATSTRANFLNTGGGLGLDVNGDGMTAHVWDGGPTRPTHQEFDGSGGNNRVAINDGVTTLNGNSFHAQHVTGTIVASGFDSDAKGMAWQADALTHDWNSDLSEATAEAANGMLLSNHSYGYRASDISDQWFGAYREDARDWDELMYNTPYYLMVVAAGNDGNDNSSNGAPLDGEADYDKLSGTSTSKNNLAVANGLDATIDGNGNVVSASRNSGSSEGPTDDYRIKPDIMGNGTGLYSTYDNADNAYNSISGTSMASPNVTGTLLLLQEHYHNLSGNYMKAATLKGIALHTADDVSTTGPDAQTGWGLLNGKKAAETLTTSTASSGSAIVNELTLSQGQTYQITVQSNGSDPLQASISWTDPAGTLNNNTNDNTPALINDLDVRLDNGTNYSPWRLTGVTTNGSGDNMVDPYERIDINSASGVYTLTVTHKGTLSGGAQDFSLIVTGVVVATSPEISFASPTGNTEENTNCSFSDIDVPLNIAQGASEDADVTFTVSGGTATEGLDYDLLTPTITFPEGTVDLQNMTLRIYHDGFVESDETVDIEFTVNPNGGDAIANTNANTFTLTINDDDLAPTSSQNNILFFEDFDDGDFEVSTSGDGDSDFWGVGNNAALTSTYWTTTGNATVFAFTSDDICNCDKSNDLLFTNSFSLDGEYTNATLTFDHAFSNIPGETGTVNISVNGGSSFTTISTLSNSSVDQGGGSFSTPWVNNNTIDLSSYIGEADVIVQFKYDDGGNWLYGMAVDNISVTATSNTNVQTAVNSGAPDEISIPGSGTVYASDPTSENVMADVVNNNNDDYGCTEISVSRAGTGAQSYNGSVLPDLAMDKTFTINTETAIASGDVEITFYFSETEIDGWESATGLTINDLEAAREDNAIETSSLTVGSFGSNVTLTGTFTSLSGTYYFGSANTFDTCTGVVKTWSGSTWSPSGAPDDTNPVIINGTYSASIHGDLTACTLTVSSGENVIVGADKFIKVNGNIIIDGVLTVEHEGSLVQVDDNATVTNNGTITVEKTSPSIGNRGFMIASSPMTEDTKAAFGNPIQFRNHITGNFVPNQDVEDDFPDANNFADDNGDNWQQYAGMINPGEGYLMMPQTTPTIGTPASYDFEFDQGTLNNGVISFTLGYNGTQNGSPNILGNPYASAIDVDVFFDDNTMIDDVYFWEHLNPPSNYPGYNVSNYDMGDISIYNETMGGVPAANGGATPNEYIASGQGFGVKPNSGGTVVFNNAMRVTDNNNTYRNNEIEKDRVWVNVFNDAYKLGSTTMIGYSEVTTDGFDDGVDSKRLATPVSIYSELETGEQLVIQGRKPFDIEDEVMLSFSTQIEEVQTYIISIHNLEGINVSDATVYLLDTKNGNLTNLSQEDYTFSSNVGTYQNRFKILYKGTVLNTSDNVLETISVFPNPAQDIINVISPKATIQSIIMTDIRGRKVMIEQASNQNEIQVGVSSLDSAVYFMTVSTTEGTITKRVVKK